MFASNNWSEMPMAFCRYFNVCIFEDFFCFVFILLFYDEVWFFCVYIITNVFSFFFKKWPPFLVILLYICHLNHQQMRLVGRQMHCYLHLIFYPGLQKEALCQERILPMLWGHLVLFPLLILWIVYFEYKELLVTNSSCWYMLILMGKVFLYYEEMPPDLLHWRHLVGLPLIRSLWFFTEHLINGMNSRFTTCILSCAKLKRSSGLQNISF